MNRYRLVRRAAIAASLAGLVAVIVNCGSSDDESLFAPCTGLYSGQCGKSCAIDAECADGLYCAPNQTCTADCAPNYDCAGGVACSARGRCATSGSLGDPDPRADANGRCAGTSVNLERTVPQVLFLLDQSSSMFTNKFPSGGSNNCNPDCRWTTLKDVLIGPAQSPGGLLKELEGQADIALELFSATDPNVGDGDDSYLTGATDNVCPRFNGRAFDGLSFERNASSSAEALLRNATVDDDTPTGPAIRAVVGLGADGSVADARGFAGLATQSPKVLVLVTDGEPALCGESPSDPGRAASVSAVQDTFKQNIRTFVIAIGDTVAGAAHFNAVANAGQGQDPVTGSARAILPSTSSALVDALRKIVLDARTCSYDLDGEVVPGAEKLGTVTLNGQPLTYLAPGTSDGEGWKLTTPSRIELVGAPCTTMKTSATAVLEASFPCGALTSPK